MRDRYGQALASLPPATLARLRQARSEVAQRRSGARRAFGWLLATGCASVFALAIGLQLQRVDSPSATAPASAVAGTERTGDFGSATGALDENPDFYLWLAASDDALPSIQE
ncbi:hypothetical protein EER27_06975 [Lysobacter psychrotolerans]|uniref:DUF3619 family protein n=1 Tax=Montanilutibacter psychrotolerans TaxID=1327343 RepID=A0A3M8STA0_9GAMM|nr:hypothetical protein EER27_06975 [Lysobacter psychrotolerans]